MGVLGRSMRYRTNDRSRGDPISPSTFRFFISFYFGGFVRITVFRFLRSVYNSKEGVKVFFFRGVSSRDSNTFVGTNARFFIFYRALSHVIGRDPRFQSRAFFGLVSYHPFFVGAIM